MTPVVVASGQPAADAGFADDDDDDDDADEEEDEDEETARAKALGDAVVAITCD